MRWLYELCATGWRGPLMMGIFWVVIIVGIVFLVRYFKREDAAEILERRYANGDLNREEYFVMKADLRKQEESE